MATVPILLYHTVRADPPPWIAPLTVTPRTFTQHLDLLAASGIHIVPLRRLVSAARGGPPLPAQAAVLTFDDGFADFYWTVAPLLADRQLPATLFVTTGAIHPPGGPASGSALPDAPMLNWRQVSTLDAYGVEIGGHSRTHAELDLLPARHLRDEIDFCKDDLEQALQHSVDAFAYPHGYSTPAIRRRLRDAGWAYACAAGDALSSAADDTTCLARLTVRADTSVEQITAWAHGTGAPVAPRPEGLPICTWRTYRRIKNSLRPLPTHR